MQEIKYQAFTGDGLYLHESTRIVGCKFFNFSGHNHHGMELHGDDGVNKYIINECVIDNIGVKPNDYDEGVALVNAPIVEFNRCRFANLGKACLVGNGDYVEQDKKLRVIFNDCIFENCGRRGPFIQYGYAELNNCLIKNWGPSDYFYLKSFGLRVGKKAQCVVNNTVFWQDHFYPGLKNFITDIVSQYDPVLIPGNFRAAYAETGGELTLNNCYFNSHWLYTRGKINGYMDPDGAKNTIEDLNILVPKL